MEIKAENPEGSSSRVEKTSEWAAALCSPGQWRLRHAGGVAALYTTDCFHSHDGYRTN